MSVMGKTTVLLLAAVAAMAQAAFDPFAGSFAGKDLRLELRGTGAGAYAGTIAVQGQEFPVTGRAANAQLAGVFTSGANRFSFTATVAGNQMRLVSEGSEYLLTRQAAMGAGNPLAVSGAAGTVHEHAKGFRIRPAEGWRAQDTPDGVMLVPPDAAGNNEEVYLAVIQDGYSAAEEANSVRQLSQAFLQNGGQVRRAGERQQFAGGTAYYWEVVDTATRRVAGLKIYFTPSGTRANVVIAFGVAERIAGRDGELRAMLGSLRAVAPKAMAAGAGGPLADNTPLAQQWLRKLQGKMIRQFHAYQGMSSDKRHMLNADGSYWFRSSSMVSVDAGGASGMSAGKAGQQGRWRIRDIGGQVVLQVQYSDGGSGQYRLTADDRNWYMNGEKAFAVDPE